MDPFSSPITSACNGFIDLLRTIHEKMPRNRPPTANVTSLDAVIARATAPARVRASR